MTENVIDLFKVIKRKYDNYRFAKSQILKGNNMDEFFRKEKQDIRTEIVPSIYELTKEERKELLDMVVKENVCIAYDHEVYEYVINHIRASFEDDRVLKLIQTA